MASAAARSSAAPTGPFSDPRSGRTEFPTLFPSFPSGLVPEGSPLASPSVGTTLSPLDEIGCVRTKFISVRLQCLRQTPRRSPEATTTSARRCRSRCRRGPSRHRFSQRGLARLHLRLLGVGAVGVIRDANRDAFVLRHLPEGIDARRCDAVIHDGRASERGSQRVHHDHDGLVRLPLAGQGNRLPDHRLPPPASSARMGRRRP